MSASLVLGSGYRPKSPDPEPILARHPNDSVGMLGHLPHLHCQGGYRDIPA